MLVNSNSLCSLKITPLEGKFFFLYINGGYAAKSNENDKLRNSLKQAITTRITCVDTSKAHESKLHRSICHAWFQRPPTHL